MKDKDINRFCVKENDSIRSCMEVIDQNKQGIALIVNTEQRLTGTVTDGDIRRIILAGKSLEGPVSKIMWTDPLSTSSDSSETEIKELMNRYLVRNIPILDENGCPCRIVNLRDLVPEEDGGQCAVIMAGGEGKRLRPITEGIPKPMIEVGGKPILESIIKALTQNGIPRMFISVNYKADVIEDYFQDGSNHGAEITYLKEEKKLGTAGALTLLPEIPSKFLLVINGDVITKTNFSRLIDFHRAHRCVMTVAATQYVFDIPYGVLELSGHYLLGIKEKPKKRFLCNAGIYMINTEVLPLIPKDTEYDMTDLIKTLVAKGLPVTTFPVHEHWIDIGRMEDLKRVKGTKKL